MFNLIEEDDRLWVLSICQIDGELKADDWNKFSGIYRFGLTRLDLERFVKDWKRVRDDIFDAIVLTGVISLRFCTASLLIFLDFVRLIALYKINIYFTAWLLLFKSWYKCCFLKKGVACFFYFTKNSSWFGLDDWLWLTGNMTHLELKINVCLEIVLLIVAGLVFTKLELNWHKKRNKKFVFCVWSY